MWQNMQETVRYLFDDADLFERLTEKYAEEFDSDLTRSLLSMAYFVHLREAGQSRNLAAMAACGAAPRAMTDREFLAGIGTLDKQFEGDARGLQQIISAARARGYNPSPNDFYMANVAKYPGDPQAFVKGRGDLLAVCKERGLPCQGAVNYAGSEPKPVKRTPLAPDIVNRLMKQEYRKDPDLKRRVKPSELRKQIIAKHGPQKL